MFQQTRSRRTKPINETPKIPTLEEFIKNRDYNGALTLLEFNSSHNTINDNQDESVVNKMLWKAYCSFHNGSLTSAQDIYQDLLASNHDDLVPEKTVLHLACVYYYMQLYEEALEAAEGGPECPLKHRILLHASLKLGDEEKVAKWKALLSSDDIEDQLSKAAMLYVENHFQESNEVYKRCLIKQKDMIALNIYRAMCYFKLVRANIGTFIWLTICLAFLNSLLSHFI